MDFSIEIVHLIPLKIFDKAGSFSISEFSCLARLFLFVLPAASSVYKVGTTLFCKTNRTNQTQESKQSKNFQHVSAGPQPIFGLAVGLRGLGAARMKHAGPPGPRGSYEMPENLFLYSLSEKSGFFRV
jgi:hypothetical protein